MSLRGEARGEGAGAGGRSGECDFPSAASDAELLDRGGREALGAGARLLSFRPISPLGGRLEIASNAESSNAPSGDFVRIDRWECKGARDEVSRGEVGVGARRNAPFLANIVIRAETTPGGISVASKDPTMARSSFRSWGSVPRSATMTTRTRRPFFSNACRACTVAEAPSAPKCTTSAGCFASSNSASSAPVVRSLTIPSFSRSLESSWLGSTLPTSNTARSSTIISVCRLPGWARRVIQGEASPTTRWICDRGPQVRTGESSVAKMRKNQSD